MELRTRTTWLLLLLGFAASTTAQAVCTDPRAFFSTRFSYAYGISYVYTPGVDYGPFPYGTPVSVTRHFRGSFWQLGLGDPAVGAGVDNGAFPAFETYPGGGYYHGWAYPYAVYPVRILGDWSQDERIDGCIDDPDGSACMAILFGDQLDGRGYFAALGAGIDSEGNHDFVQPGNAPIVLAEIPSPTIERIVLDGSLTIDVSTAELPPEGLYLDGPACSTGLVAGFKIYSRTFAAGEPPPLDRERDGSAGGASSAVGISNPVDSSTLTGAAGAHLMHADAGPRAASPGVSAAGGAPPTREAATPRGAVPAAGWTARRGARGEVAPDITSPTPGHDGARPGQARRWEVAVGGESPFGAPLAPGTRPTLYATGCTPGGSLVLAASWVLDSGFETPFVSADSAIVRCGDCALRDGDGDGFSIDPCASRTDFDCDDDNRDIGPGAPQICDDGRNNDCLHPGWPLLAGTNEVDNDGDGRTGCQGDPCPFDADDDGDGDGRCGDVDNCPTVPNADQTDRDADGLGDACDACPLDADDDADDDGRCGDVDNCPAVANVDQADADADGLGDACDRCPLDPDNDRDRDRICGDVDACPLDSLNDRDRDGLCADVDPCPFDAANDGDGDGFCADVDTCPVDPDPLQLDGDGDDIGDVCDAFGARRTIADVRDPTGLIVADLDGDGDDDVATSGGIILGRPEGTLTFHENADGSGTDWIAHSIRDDEILPNTLVAADVDGDGDLDLPFAANRRIAWQENADGRGRAWIEHPVAGGLGSVRSLFALDADGDGDVDLFAADLGGTLAWYENPGTTGPAWSRHLVAESVDSPSAVVAADLDGDGDADTAAALGSSFSANNQIVLYENLDGAGREWRPLRVADQTLNYRSLFVADVDADGDPDLLSAATFRFSTTRGAVAWHENAMGDGSAWVTHTIGDEFLNYDDGVAGDVDGDGDLDALAVGSFPDALAWFENLDGRGLRWKTRLIFEGGIRPVLTALGDLDGDGDLDALAGARLGDRVEWHENRGLPAPPTVQVRLDPELLWPPNHRMVEIEATLELTGFCEAPGPILVSIASDEPDNGPGDGDTVTDIRDAEFGTFDTRFRLRAERSGQGDGRTYTVVYRAIDCQGLAIEGSARVRVPHDMHDAAASPPAF